MPQNDQHCENMVFNYIKFLLNYNEIIFSENEILREILEELDIENQMFTFLDNLMFTILGLQETFFRHKYSDFRCSVALYFVSFFYEHPV